MSHSVNTDLERLRRETHKLTGNFGSPSFESLRQAHAEITASFAGLSLDLKTRSAADKANAVFRHAESSFQRALQDYTEGSDALSSKYTSVQKRLNDFTSPQVTLPYRPTTSLFEAIQRPGSTNNRQNFLAKWTADPVPTGLMHYEPTKEPSTLQGQVREVGIDALHLVAEGLEFVGAVMMAPFKAIAKHAEDEGLCQAAAALQGLPFQGGPGVTPCWDPETRRIAETLRGPVRTELKQLVGEVLHSGKTAFQEQAPDAYTFAADLTHRGVAKLADWQQSFNQSVDRLAEDYHRDYGIPKAKTCQLKSDVPNVAVGLGLLLLPTVFKRAPKFSSSTALQNHARELKVKFAVGERGVAEASFRIHTASEGEALIFAELQAQGATAKESLHGAVRILQRELDHVATKFPEVAKMKLSLSVAEDSSQFLFRMQKPAVVMREASGVIPLSLPRELPARFLAAEESAVMATTALETAAQRVSPEWLSFVVNGVGQRQMARGFVPPVTGRVASSGIVVPRGSLRPVFELPMQGEGLLNSLRSAAPLAESAAPELAQQFLGEDLRGVLGEFDITKLWGQDLVQHLSPHIPDLTHLSREEAILTLKQMVGHTTPGVEYIFCSSEKELALEYVARKILDEARDLHRIVLPEILVSAKIRPEAGSSESVEGILAVKTASSQGRAQTIEQIVEAYLREPTDAARALLEDTFHQLSISLGGVHGISTNPLRNVPVSKNKMTPEWIAAEATYREGFSFEEGSRIARQHRLYLQRKGMPGYLIDPDLSKLSYRSHDVPGAPRQPRIALGTIYSSDAKGLIASMTERGEPIRSPVYDRAKLLHYVKTRGFSSDVVKRLTYLIREGCMDGSRMNYPLTHENFYRMLFERQAAERAGSNVASAVALGVAAIALAGCSDEITPAFQEEIKEQFNSARLAAVETGDLEPLRKLVEMYSSREGERADYVRDVLGPKLYVRRQYIVGNDEQRRRVNADGYWPGGPSHKQVLASYANLKTLVSNKVPAYAVTISKKELLQILGTGKTSQPLLFETRLSYDYRNQITLFIDQSFDWTSIPRHAYYDDEFLTFAALFAEGTPLPHKMIAGIGVPREWDEESINRLRGEIPFLLRGTEIGHNDLWDTALLARGSIIPTVWLDPEQRPSFDPIDNIEFEN